MAGHSSRHREWKLSAMLKMGGLCVLLLPLIATLVNREPPEDWKDLHAGLAMVVIAVLLIDVISEFIPFALMCRLATNSIKPRVSLLAEDPQSIDDDEEDRDTGWGKGPPWSPSLVPAPRKPPSLAAHAAPPVE